MSISEMMRRARFVVLVLILFTVSSAFAQFSASLSGTVEDPSGAVVAGASVTLTYNATQEQKVFTTGGSGFYRFNGLAPGRYTLVIVAPGFETNTIDLLEVVAESARGLDVTLKVGKATQNVNVNASAIPDLQTGDANVQATIDSEAVERLPSFGADPYELLRTAPGITGDSARSSSGLAVFLPNGAGPGQSNSGIYQTENQIQISAQGLPVADNNYLLDGVSVNSLGQGGAAVVTPNVDSVSQITVVSGSFSAEDGRNSGAQIKTISKSGANSIHGSARFQYDEPGLNAYNGFTGPAGQMPQRVDNKQRYYGGSLGGPIIKDKLFWFISGEAFRQNQNSFESQYVETPQYVALVNAERPGNIASTIVNELGLPRVTQVLNQSCTSPANIGTPCQVVNGGIDLGSPYGMEGQYVPLALAQQGSGLDGIPDVQYAEIAYPTRLRARQYNARVDYNLTHKDLVAASFFYTKLDNDNASSTSQSLPGDDLPFKPENLAATLIFIHTFSANTQNDIRANFTRLYDNGIADAASKTNFGIPYVNVQNMNFDSVNDIQYGVQAASTTPSILTENQYEVRDTVTHIWGSHTIRAGFEFRPEQDYSNLAGNDRPTYAFAGIWNFMNDTPIFESVTANPLTGGPGQTQRYLRDHYIGAFAQHDWKAASNLQFNVGLRWEYFEPVHNTFPVNQPVLSTATPGAELTGAILTLHNHFYNSESHDFSPKIAFAWQPKSDPNMVVRGGFGMAYNRLPDALFDPSTEDGPGIANFNLCCGTAPGDFGSPYAGGTILYALGTSNSPFSYPANPALAVGVNPTTGVPNGQSIEVYGSQPNIHTPYTYLYSLEVQREIGHDFVFSIGYQGNESFHQPRLVNQLFIYPNQPSPNFYAYYQVQTDSIGNYNGLNVQLNRRFNRGLTLSSVYTWSKAMDEISNGYGANAAGNQSYPTVNHWNYGPADYDVNSRFVASALWDIPAYHPSNPGWKLLTGGWQLNGIFTAHTGFPFTPVTYTINGLPTTTNNRQISPVRPATYDQSLNFNTCGNDRLANGSDVPFRLTAAQSTAYFGYPGLAGSALNNFDIDPKTGKPIPFGTNPYAGIPPQIGRNAFRGPCYQDIDISAAKQFSFSALGHEPLLRFQCNAYNALNHTNLTPFGYASPSTLIESSNFGIAQTADAGRVIEFLIRLQF